MSHATERVIETLLVADFATRESKGQAQCPDEERRKHEGMSLLDGIGAPSTLSAYTQCACFRAIGFSVAESERRTVLRQLADATRVLHGCRFEFAVGHCPVARRSSDCNGGEYGLVLGLRPH